MNVYIFFAFDNIELNCRFLCSHLYTMSEAVQDFNRNTVLFDVDVSIL